MINHKIGELELVDTNSKGSFDLEHPVCEQFYFLGGGEGYRVYEIVTIAY